MRYRFPGSYPNQEIQLSFAREDFVGAGYVLVFAFYEGQLLLTRHQKRGWEVPGGTREAGEWPIQTAIREVYEETGAELDAIEPIGQYVIETPGELPLVKTIYIANIAQIHPLPDGFETEEIALHQEPPTSEQIIASDAYSLILKDDVYRLTMERLQGHRFLTKVSEA